MGMLGKLFHHKDRIGLGDLKLGDEKLDKELDEATLSPDKGFPSIDQSMAMQGGGGLDKGFDKGFSSFSKQQDFGLDQEMKLLTSKIDTLIAKMDNMNQRIANLERIASEAQK